MSTTLQTRQDALVAHLRHIAANGLQMVHALDHLAGRIKAAAPDASDPAERPEFLYEEGIDAVEKFLHNVSFVTAARLLTRYTITKPNET